MGDMKLFEFHAIACFRVQRAEFQPQPQLVLVEEEHYQQAEVLQQAGGKTIIGIGGGQLRQQARATGATQTVFPEQVDGETRHVVGFNHITRCQAQAQIA